GRFEYAGDRYGVVGEHLLVGAQFNPEVGYVRRTDFRRSFGSFRFSPRPKNAKTVRRYNSQISYDYDTSADGSRVQDKELRGMFTTEFQNGDSWTVADYTADYEFLPAKFVINPGTTVPAGSYDYQNVRTRYSLGQQRKVSGSISAAY